ncbi:MAG: alpha/beta fold hydrolase [Chloroflexi bacterium]|nr:alpha/beta fold hydrolase [Chloroflexota bacterium]
MGPGRRSRGWYDRGAPVRSRTARSMPINTDNQLTLPDGRRLGYASYGADDGWPVLFFHGIPGSRHSSHSAGLVGQSHGARVIAFDRPGYGLSDRLPGRQIHDWPTDVADALDVLGIDRFSVFGYSGGGPFALATAAAMPDRVASVANVSAMGPLRTPEADARLTRRQRLERFAMARLAPVVRFRTRQVARAIESDVGMFLQRRSNAAPEADRTLIRQPAINAVMRQDLLASVARGGGRGDAGAGVAVASAALGVRCDLGAGAAAVVAWDGRRCGADVAGGVGGGGVASRGDAVHRGCRALADVGSHD